MKKFIFLTVFLAVTLVMPASAFANVGDFGFFGGISSGRKLPKTTELILDKTSSGGSKDELETVYKEKMFLTGVPVTFEGQMTVETSGEADMTKNADTYDVTYTVEDSATTDPDNTIDREIKYEVNYRVEGNQVIKDYEVDTWNETLTIGGAAYVLDGGL